MKLKQLDKVIIATMLYHEEEKCSNTAATIGMTARVRGATTNSDEDIFGRLDVLETCGLVVNIGFLTDTKGNHLNKFQLSNAAKAALQEGGCDVRKNV